MARLPPSSVDAIVCDPPYGLSSKSPGIKAIVKSWENKEPCKGPKRGYGGQEWDKTVPSPVLWEAALRVLKPGGFLLAFAAPRTRHLVAAGLEWAGLEIRDELAWIYSEGNPNARELVPAHEPIIVARKPLSEKTLRDNVKTHGTGRLCTDPRRVAGGDHSSASRRLKNVIISHAGDCSYRAGRWECVPGCSVLYLENQKRGRSDCYPLTAGESAVDLPELEAVLRGDAPDFNYSAKPRAEREEGLAAAGIQPRSGPSTTPGRRSTKRLNPHLTVKPAAAPDSVMRWLVRLACPEGGVVMDPFNGSGSTGIAAVLEGRRYIGIDVDETEGYLEVAAARIAYFAVKEGILPPPASVVPQRTYPHRSRRPGCRLLSGQQARAWASRHPP